MARKNLVASVKAKEKVKSKKTEDFIPPELFEIDDSNFTKKYEGYSINFACQNATEYINNLEVPIHLVVTSPPYNCDIQYDTYVDNQGWDDYEKWMIEVFSSAFTKMVDGGRVVVNFPQFVKGESGRKALSTIFERVLLKSGFELVDFITWIKAKDEREAVGAAGRSTAWGSWMSPSSPNMRPITELIIVAKKPGKFISNNTEITITTEEFKSYTISAWFFNGASSKHHPATFPPELASRAIKLYSYKFDNILDPFLGIGSSALSCSQLQRSFYGCDISKKYIRVSANRL